MLDLDSQRGAGDEVVGGHVHGLVVVQLFGGPVFDRTDDALAQVHLQGRLAPFEIQGLGRDRFARSAVWFDAAFELAEDVLKDLLGEGIIQNVPQHLFLLGGKAAVWFSSALDLRLLFLADGLGVEACLARGVSFQIFLEQDVGFVQAGKALGGAGISGI